MKKKVLSLVLALLMTASAASTVLADDVVAIAEDTAVEAVAEEIAEPGQYDKEIAFLAHYGIFKGYSADDTGAEDLIQRYQMALFVSRIATGWVEDEKWEDGPENWSEFSDIDVDPVNNYFGALSFASQKGIIEGYGNGKFGPTDSITYQNALTMVVRTLGYTTLDWPWGYIQKAVELGLTDGITGVAYTQELTRGEVAKIIYNALFADCKDGSTLAAKYFNVEFGWEKVVITASDENTFVKDGKTVGEKFVEFKLLNDDGTLGDDAFRALAADFELDYTKHEDDLAVGKAYYVLFEKDTDSNLAEIINAVDLYVGTVANEGKTDDYGDPQDYDLKAYLDEHSIVDKYTGNSYVNVTASLKPELLVWNTTSDIVEAEVNGYNVKFDLAKNTISEPKKDSDGKIVKDKDGNIEFEVVWQWSEIYETFFKFVADKDGHLTKIERMSAKDLDKYLDAVKTTKDVTYRGFAKLTSAPANTAYAALDLYDTNLDGVEDRGLYESYALGYFKNDTKKCTDCNADKASYMISPVDTFAKAINAAAGADEKFESVVFEEIVEGACGHGAKAIAYFVEGYEPETAYDKDGEAAGYANGYVIYSADKETGAIKVIKNIGDGTDADTYIKTGVVRAYNVNNETITIGEDDLTMSYNELAGTGFYKVSKNAATKAAYTGLLRGLFNQFVTYVVVDGELVHIEAKNPDKDDVIVVESYAGLSSDGYIVVNGYSTADLKYDQFRIGSLEGWKKGDAYYYAQNYTDLFEEDIRGAVLSIVSEDEDKDLVYVNYFEAKSENEQRPSAQTLGEWDENGTDVVRIAYDDSRYASRQDWSTTNDEFGTASYRLMDKDDTYIIVTKAGVDAPYASVKVYTGKLFEGAYIEGQLIKNDTDKDVYVFVNAYTNIKDTYKTGLVVLLDDTYYSANYNGVNAEDWYLLGAVKYEVKVFDLLTGKDDLVVGAVNKDLDEGKVYFTQSGVIVSEVGTTYNTATKAADSIVKAVNDAYGDADTYVAKTINEIGVDTNTNIIRVPTKDDDSKYIAIGKNNKGEKVYFDDLYVTKDNAYRAPAEAMLINDKVIDDDTVRGDKVTSITYRVITIDEDNIISIDTTVKGGDDASKLNNFIADNKYTTLSAFYIYDFDAKAIVVYLVVNKTDAESVVTKTATGSITAAGKTGLDDDKTNDKDIVLKSFDKGVNLVASEIGYTAKYENEVITGAAITSLKFGFEGDYLDELLEKDSLPVDNDVHKTPDFIYTYGTAALKADGTVNADVIKTRYTFGTCAAGANTYALVGGIEVAVKSVKEVTYDGVCGLIRGFEIEFAEEVYVPAENLGADVWTFELHIPEVGAKNADRVYYFGVDVDTTTMVNGETVKNVVLINN